MIMIIRLLIIIAVTMGVARHPDADLDIRYLTRGQKIARTRALLALKKRRRRRWECDVPDCDGLPHPGWLHHHARAKQRIPRWFWTTWVLLTGRGWGKAVRLSTKIPTPGGWTTMGEIEIGDYVLDEAGRPCRVTGTFEVPNPETAYRVTFSDGTHIDACGEHQWVTWDAKARKALNRWSGRTGAYPGNWPAWRAGGRWGTRSDARGPEIRTTQQIVDTFRDGKRGDLNHSVPTTAPLDLPEADLPVDPYLLGYWLGDGSKSDGTFACHPSDQPHLTSALAAAGYTVTSCSEIQVRTRGLYRGLRLAGVLRNKHVPAAYLRGSIDQREALLAGLMDSDGYAERSKVEFCATNRVLADAVLELARSLGQKPRLYEDRARLNGEDCGPRYRVVWRPTRQPFRLPRKADRVVLGDAAQSLRNHHRMIVSVEPIDPVPMRCISVDSPNRMYLVGEGMIPTHNTRTAAEVVKEWAKTPNQFIAVIAKNETLVREICFEHKKSGLLVVLDPNDVLEYHSSKGNVHIIMKNGTIIRGFGAEVPDNLRGWAFDKAWADEYAAWKRQTAQESMDMIWFCLREAAAPQVIVSTTPKPLPHVVKLVRRNQAQVKRIQEQTEAYAAGETDQAPAEGPRVVITQGHTDENQANLSDVALGQLEDDYGGTRLGEQELGGILLEDVEGALWQRWMFEVDGFRPERKDVPRLQRKVVAVDPATTTTETADDTGFAVMGRTHWLDPRTNKDDRPHGYLLRSERKKMTPRQTMAHAAQLYHEEQADVVVIEANNGGDYLPTVLEMVDPTVNWRVVNATRDKRARATPFATLYEQERMHHVGSPRDFDHVETVMTTYVGAPERDEKSPDDLDAAVWAAWDLFHDPATALARPSLGEWAKQAIGHPMGDPEDLDDGLPSGPPASGRGRLPRRR